MRSTTVVALFAGSAAAQLSAVIFNPLEGIIYAPTLTVLGSSSGTTTYVNSCSEPGIPAKWLATATAVGSTASSAASSARAAAGTLALTPISAPSTTTAARLRRQDGLYGDFCEPFTLKQGSSSMDFHMEDPVKNAWTADIKCGWKGEMTTADLTCTASQSGIFVAAALLSTDRHVETSIVKASELATQIATLSVVHPASNSASATASGSQSGSANVTSTTSGSGAPAATGAAAAGAPLSKGVMAFVGGAAGVFAAALAL